MKNLVMKGSKDLTQYKVTLLFLAKAFLIYFMLICCYKGYVGLADPAGRYNLTNIFGGFNLIKWITVAHVWVSDLMLHLIGFTTETTWKVIKIAGAGGVQIEYACLGIELWIAFVALIFAYPIPVNKPLRIKSVASITGILCIFILNNFRVVTIVLTNHYSYQMTQTIHDIFNYLVYILIFLTFFSWVKYFNKKQRMI